jgi:uncharacterized protein YndB with AHSA1/START domain
MASIHTETTIQATPEKVWAALRDWATPHLRLFPGLLVDVTADGPERTVTLINGQVVHEQLITSDDHARRLVWTVVDGPFSHYNAAAQVLSAADGNSTFVWTTDFAPDEITPVISELMANGATAARTTLEGGV